MRLIARRTLWVALIALGVVARTGAADPIMLRVNVFPTAKILPIFIGLDQGIFAAHRLKVDLQYTENSAQQRAGLAAGAFPWLRAGPLRSSSVGTAGLAVFEGLRVLSEREMRLIGRRPPAAASRCRASAQPSRHQRLVPNAVRPVGVVAKPLATVL